MVGELYRFVLYKRCWPYGRAGWKKFTCTMNSDTKLFYPYYKPTESFQTLAYNIFPLSNNLYISSPNEILYPLLPHIIDGLSMGKCVFNVINVRLKAKTIKKSFTLFHL